MQALNIARVLANCLRLELTDEIGHFVRGKDNKAVCLGSTLIGCNTTKSFEEAHLNLNESLRF
jgi:hypothetical protein